MKVALVGDIHANLPALEAVLEHARRTGAEQIWNSGDSVGYNAFPEQVIQRLRAESVVSVIGNYDLKVLKFPNKGKKWKKKKRFEKWLAFKWAYEQLSAESLDYLASLPEQQRLKIEEQMVLLTHGSPASVEEHLYADTAEERLAELGRLADADLVVCGHSHQAFARRVEGVWFVNTGSVGRPDDGDPRATYAVLESDRRSIGIRHYRVSYDVQAAVAGIRQQGLPAAFEEMIRKGRKLDWILEQ